MNANLAKGWDQSCTSCPDESQERFQLSHTAKAQDFSEDLRKLRKEGSGRRGRCQILTGVDVLPLETVPSFFYEQLSVNLTTMKDIIDHMYFFHTLLGDSLWAVGAIGIP